VVEDDAKSAKEQWHWACFVPEGASYEDFADVCERLATVRDDRFERDFAVWKYGTDSTCGSSRSSGG
jgi:hypothetical protein